MTIHKESFGVTNSGIPVELYTLTNRSGLVARISNYGGKLVSLLTPDRNGRLGDIVWGFDRLEPYLSPNASIGTLVGRVANRTAGARFNLNGVEYALSQNSGSDHTHGGFKGYAWVVWQAEAQETQEGPALSLHYISPAGEEGYPGGLDVRVVYTLTHENTLSITYDAVPDADTIVNLTSHGYFNLTGSGNIYDHILWINADAFTPVDAGFVTTGEIRPVAGTPLNFRQPRPIGAGINVDYEQLSLCQGYNHNFCLNSNPERPEKMAELFDPASGRVMELFTTAPGLQLYTANILPAGLIGKGNWAYQKYGAVCLEAQHYPNAANHPGFPSIAVRRGEHYRQVTIHRFGVR